MESHESPTPYELCTTTRRTPSAFIASMTDFVMSALVAVPVPPTVTTTTSAPAIAGRSAATSVASRVKGVIASPVGGSDRDTARTWFPAATA